VTRWTSLPVALQRDVVRVRWLPVDAEETPHLTRWRSMLDQDELDRADRYHFAVDRNIYTAAHALARLMLSEATGLSTDVWRYTVGQFGKPALAADLSKWNLHHNISHTRGLAACAIATHDIGIDVERSDQTIDPGIARDYFAPEEIRILNSAAQSQKHSLFFRFWSLKEAFIKATGEGLSRPLDSFSFSFEPLRIAFHPERNHRRSDDNPAEWRFWELHPANGCVAALAVRSTCSGCIQIDARPVAAAEVRPL
jgi:4'-phosphopantetheinyl transferase